MPDLLRLNMIVKNEARNIRKTLESVKPFIDSWVIVDTGSTDGTQDIIYEVLGSNGRLIERPFVPYKDTGIIDFAATRNMALELALEDPSIFILLLNGDDILVNGESLRFFCEVAKNDREPAYYLTLKGFSGGECDTTRLIRSNNGWRYSLPTHEVIHGPTPVGGRITGAYINHVAGSSPYRWRQDITVFEHYLQDNPDDYRAVFYLAQSHECLAGHLYKQPSLEDKINAIDHYQKAAELYLKRSEMDGWIEETYEALRRRASCCSLTHSWPEVQQMYLDAYAKHPKRLEAVYQIAEYWHKKDNHILATLYSQNFDTTPPGAALCLDRSIYQWKLADIFATHAFYTGQKERGRQAAEQALKYNPTDKRIYRNRAFYIRGASDLFPSFLSKPLETNIIQLPYSSTNPSVCFNGQTRAAILRGVNFEPTSNGYRSRESDKVFRTVNYWLEFNKDWDIITSHILDDKTNRPHSTYPVHGYEDMRLFWWKDQWWASATICDAIDRGTSRNTGQLCEMALLSLSDTTINTYSLLRGSWSRWHQKNWRPVVRDNRLFWIYTTDPLSLLEWNGSKVIDDPVCPAPPPNDQLRGSSQAIQLPDGRFLWVDHAISMDKGGHGRLYWEYFVLVNKDLTKVISISEPFYLNNKPCMEFCCGLALDGDTVVLSYGVNDLQARIGFVPLQEVLSALNQ